VSCKDLGPVLGGLLCKGSKDPCHGVKPVALRPGSQQPPGAPEVLPVQIVRIGQLALLAVPAELTTMAGRRLVSTVRPVLAPLGVKHLVLAGYANAYAGYVTTREEYQVQDYEGASTHFGEWTLAAYRQQMRELARAMAAGKPVDDPLVPRDLLGSLQNKELTHVEAAPLAGFGSVAQDAEASYAPGEQVEVVFRGANLSNDPLLQGSFLDVVDDDGEVVARDWSWETFLGWQQTLTGGSRVTVRWRIPEDQAPGSYAIVHRGFYKDSANSLRPYQGVSRSFTVK
jgi:neutral ceramidase